MESETKILVAEAACLTCFIAGYILYARNVDANNVDVSTQPNESTGNCDSTPAGYITNPETCADHKLVSDPRDNSKLCAEKGMYSIDNPRTLFGLRRTVGEGTSREVEIIDPATKEVIGYFPESVNASFEAMYKPAMPDAIACLVD